MLPEERRRMERGGILFRLRTDPAVGRATFLRVTGASVAVVTLTTVILVVLALTSSADLADLADRLAAAGDVLVGATLILAALAAVVALLAYAVSTGRYTPLLAPPTVIIRPREAQHRSPRTNPCSTWSTSTSRNGRMTSSSSPPT